MLVSASFQTVRILCSGNFPTGRTLKSALSRGIPNATGSRTDSFNSLIGFITPDIYQEFLDLRNLSPNWYYADHAYFKRHQYYRITKQAYQHPSLGESSGRRFRALGIEIKPWRKHGDFILLCPQSDVFMRQHGTSRDEWIHLISAELRRYTDREIRIHDKNRRQSEVAFASALVGAYAVVVFTSVAGVHAAIHGVPCFTTQVCSATAFGRLGVHEIENPHFPEDRLERLSVLADHQWTLSEIRSGRAWRDLQEQ